MSRRTPLPRELYDRPFLARTALDLGVSAKRLRAKDLSGQVWGTRLAAGAAGDLRERCRAFLLRLPEHAFFSHVTAARLHGFPLPKHLEDRWRLDISCPSPHRAPDIRGVRGHQLSGTAGTIGWLDGLPVTRVARTWCDLGADLRLRDLVAVADHLARLAGSADGLAAELADYPGRRGRAALRAAMAMVDARSESPAESALRTELVLAGLPQLVVNGDLRGSNGRFVARPDLRFADFPVILEYEGDHHRVERGQWMKDIARTAALEALGYSVIRCTSLDLRNPAPLLDRVRAHLGRHGWRP